MTPMPKAASGAPGPETTDEVIEKVRVPFIQRATLTRNGAEEPLFLVDLGVEGAFAERPAAPVGEVVGLHFRLPGTEIPLAVGCRVAGQTRGRGAGLEVAAAGVGLWFVEMEPAAAPLRAYLSDYLRGGRCAGSTGPGHRTWRTSHEHDRSLVANREVYTLSAEQTVGRPPATWRTAAWAPSRCSRDGPRRHPPERDSEPRVAAAVDPDRTTVADVRRATWWSQHPPTRTKRAAEEKQPGAATCRWSRRAPRGHGRPARSAAGRLTAKDEEIRWLNAYVHFIPPAREGTT